MNSFTHKRKDYRITAIKLKFAMSLGNGQIGDVGDYFVNDEEGEQYILRAEKMEADFEDVSKIRVHVNPNDGTVAPDVSWILNNGFEVDPSRYTVTD